MREDRRSVIKQDMYEESSKEIMAHLLILYLQYIEAIDLLLR